MKLYCTDVDLAAAIYPGIRPAGPNHVEVDDLDLARRLLLQDKAHRVLYGRRDMRPIGLCPDVVPTDDLGPMPTGWADVAFLLPVRRGEVASGSWGGIVTYRIDGDSNGRRIVALDVDRWDHLAPDHVCRRAVTMGRSQWPWVGPAPAGYGISVRGWVTLTAEEAADLRAFEARRDAADAEAARG